MELLLYIAVTMIGGAVGTYVAVNWIELTNSSSLVSSVVYAFFGSFGFGIVLGNTNVLLFNEIALSFQDWLGKARDPAVTAANRNQTKREKNIQERMVQESQHVPEEQLNTRLLALTNEEYIQKLEDKARASNSDIRAYKALELAKLDPDAATAILKKIKKSW